ncbi:sigma-70 family RNA polymerase sigma factor [Pseudonocardia sp. T1-2H]|uniref:sigma-70 family RNA polymerase sigma factor n=1 Tax=Pseudonocardia sp. T1-2H TaxID=3128899 RepID=UPI003101047D
MTTVLTRPLRPPAGTLHVRTAPVRPDAAGSGDALRVLYRDHAAALLAYAEWFTDDRPAAEDAVQETFLRAWRNLPRLQVDERPLRPWLRQVLRHVLIDAARAARARPVGLPDDTLMDREVDGGYEDMLDRGMLARALRQLSPAHRQVLVEIYYHDAPAEQVAAELGVPAGTVRSRLYYALRALRRQLTDFTDAPLPVRC